MKRFSALIPVICLLLASCQKELPARLELGQTSVSFESPAGGTQVNLVSTRSWTAKASAPWCRVIPDSGNGGVFDATDLTIVCEENTGHAERNCTVTVCSGGNEQTITVTQGHKQGVLIDVDGYELSDQAQVLTIPFWRTAPVTIDIAPEAQNWIELVSTKAMEGAELTLSIQLNRSAAREGAVYLTCMGETQTITILQRASDIPIPDQNFRSYCLQRFDHNGDRCISLDEAEAATVMDIPSYCYNLSGLEYFTSLQRIYCSSYNVTLDLRTHKNIKSLYINNIKNLLLESGSGIERLELIDTKIESLDLSTCKQLKRLGLSGNQNLSEIVLNGCRSLEDLFLENNHALTHLDASGCPALRKLEATYNHSLTSIDVHGLAHLEELNCLSAVMRSLNTSGCVAMITINCQASALSEAPDLSGMTKLEWINISHNQIQSLDIRDCRNLITVEAECNQLHTFLTGNHPQLNELQLSTNQLTSLDVSDCPALQYLFADSNSLETIELGQKPSLSQLVLTWNQLRHIDLSACSGLGSADLCDNQLETLIVRNNEHLTDLQCFNNQLTELDLTGAPRLTDLNCRNNPLTRIDLTDLKFLQHLMCCGCQLKTLDVSTCYLLWSLDCTGNQLSSLDLTGNSTLRSVKAGGNPHLEKIYLKKGATPGLVYDEDVTTIEYR